MQKPFTISCSSSHLALCRGGSVATITPFFLPMGEQAQRGTVMYQCCTAGELGVRQVVLLRSAPLPAGSGSCPPRSSAHLALRVLSLDQLPLPSPHNLHTTCPEVPCPPSGRVSMAPITLPSGSLPGPGLLSPLQCATQAVLICPFFLPGGQVCSQGHSASGGGRWAPSENTPEIILSQTFLNIRGPRDVCEQFRFLGP